MTPVLQFDNVSKSFGRNKVIQQVSFPVFEREIVALLGPNGAGKSTLLSLAFGLRNADTGSVQLFGQLPRDPKARRKLGVTPQNTSFPSFLRVKEMLGFVGTLYANEKTEEILHQFGLSSLAQKYIGTLSEGQKRRLALACAFIGDPELVLLDEPTTGLDIEARADFFKLIRQIQASRSKPMTILFSTHHLEEVEILADRVLVLHQGRLRLNGTLSEIRGRLKLKKISLRSESPPLPRPPAEMIHSFENSRDQQKGVYEIWSQRPDELVRWLVKSAHPFSDLTVEEPTLEQIFFRLLEEFKTEEAGAAVSDVVSVRGTR